MLNDIEEDHEFLNSSGPFDELFKGDFGLFIKVLIEEGFNFFGIDCLGEGEDFICWITGVDKEESECFVGEPSFLIEVEDFEEELDFLLIINWTEDDKAGEHFDGVDSAFFLGVKSLEGFLIMAENLYEFADGDGERLADGLVGRVVFAEFGGGGVEEGLVDGDFFVGDCGEELGVAHWQIKWIKSSDAKL